MKLIDVIKIEEKLLIFEEKYKHNIEFQDYINLSNCLNNIGNITSVYFSLIESYNDFINKTEIDMDKIKQMLSEYNNKLLNSSIQCEISLGVDIMNKYEK